MSIQRLARVRGVSGRRSTEIIDGGTGDHVCPGIKHTHTHTHARVHTRTDTHTRTRAHTQQSHKQDVVKLSDTF